MTSVESHTPDPVGRIMTLVYSAGVVAVLVVSYQAVRQANWPAVLLYVALTLLLAYQAVSANTMRTAHLTIDDAGIRRSGAWGWKRPWDGISSATIEEFKALNYLVVIRSDPNAPSHHSSTYLWGADFARNALVTPLDEAQVPAVERELAAHGLGGGAQ